MFIYNVIYALTIIGLLYTFKRDNKCRQINNIFYFLLSAVLLLTVSLHGEFVGYDTHSYMYLYLHPGAQLYSKSEFVLTVLSSILRFIYANKYFINFVVLFISQIPIYLLINRYSQNRYYSILLYISFNTGLSLFLISMPAVRQTLAIGFFAFAINEYLKNDEKINLRTILCLLLMFFSHHSSILVLPLFFITKIKISKKIYALISIGACMLGTIISRYIDIIMQYAMSFDKEFYVSRDSTESSILTVVPFIFAFLYLVYALPIEKLQSIWIKGMLLLVVIIGVMYPIANNLDRICAYYCLLSIFAIPESCSVKYSSINKVYYHIFSFIIIAYFSYKYFVVLNITSALDYPFVPYKTIFD